MLLLCRALAVAVALVYGPAGLSTAFAQPKADPVVWHCSQDVSLYRLRCRVAGSSAAEYPLYTATEFLPVRALLGAEAAPASAYRKTPYREAEPSAPGTIEKVDPCRGSICGGVLDPRVLKYYRGPEIYGSATAEARAFVARFDAWLRTNSRCEGGQPVVNRRAAPDASSRVLYIRACL